MATYNIHGQLTQALEWLQQQMLPDGQFPTREYTGEPDAKAVWVAGAPSPFITASVLAALVGVKLPLADELQKRGTRYLLSLSEGGYWRYWPHEYATHKVPYDADDTALCSFLLQQRGVRFRNRDAFLLNRNAEGLFYTWLLPRWSLRCLLANWRLCLTAGGYEHAMQAGMLHPHDMEPAVLANVLLYLGDGAAATTAIIYLEKCMAARNYPMQFYKSQEVVWYHVSRAARLAVPRLQFLAPVFRGVCDQLMEAAADESAIAHRLLLCNAAYNFGLLEIATSMSEPLRCKPLADFAFVYPYYHSKNHAFRAGSEALTVSWYAELLWNYTNAC